MSQSASQTYTLKVTKEPKVCEVIEEVVIRVSVFVEEVEIDKEQ
jgi:hypothetical protein